jgi:DNA uptake protein ComE-like DNA-binding protein
MRFFAAVVLLALAVGPLRAESARTWERWEDCTHLADRFFDGDSFQVKNGPRTQIVRLYGADAPETDLSYRQRVEEQAAHFGVKPSEVLRSGEAAKEFTAKFLSKPFRVVTRRKAAPGASRTERIYAMVERKGVSLDVALVEAGLARATTETADYPDAAGARARFQQLRILEQNAARERRGLWAKSTRIGPQRSLAERVIPKLFKSPKNAELRKTNLNTASTAELEALPGIGPKTAAEIISARPLKDLAALDQLPGFGPKRIEALRELISF